MSITCANAPTSVRALMVPTCWHVATRNACAVVGVPGASSHFLVLLLRGILHESGRNGFLAISFTSTRTKNFFADLFLKGWEVHVPMCGYLCGHCM